MSLYHWIVLTNCRQYVPLPHSDAICASDPPTPYSPPPPPTNSTQFFHFRIRFAENRLRQMSALSQWGGATPNGKSWSRPCQVDPTSTTLIWVAPLPHAKHDGERMMTVLYLCQMSQTFSKAGAPTDDVTLPASLLVNIHTRNTDLCYIFHVKSLVSHAPWWMIHEFCGFLGQI